MATKAQIEANRANALKSTGPRTGEGKARARGNAIRHGLCARFPLLSGESDSDVESLLQTLREEFDPVGVIEEMLVYKLAGHFFNGKRAGDLLAGQLEHAQRDEPHSVSLMLRYQGSAERGFYKTLNELRKLQKERRLQEIGSVSSDPEPIAESTPAEPPAEVPEPGEPSVRLLEMPAEPRTPASDLVEAPQQAPEIVPEPLPEAA